MTHQWLAPESGDWGGGGDAGSYPALPDILQRGNSRTAIKKAKKALGDDPLLKPVKLRPVPPAGVSSNTLHRC